MKIPVIFVVIVVVSAQKHSTEDLIKEAGYPVETHNVTTEDGYHLTLHRIPKKNTATPVLLVHPMCTSGIIWVFSITNETKAVAFTLSDNNYDVWILHHRGTRESLCHKTLNYTEIDFWNFTAHESAVYDVGNSVDYILETTGKPKISYFGTSQGSTEFLILLATNPEFNNKISSAYLVAPIASFQLIAPTVQLIYGSDFSEILFLLISLNGMGYIDFANQNVELTSSKFALKLMLGAMSLVVGEFNPKLDYATIINITSGVIFDHVGISTVKHFHQLFRNHRFTRNDYGSTENLQRYGQKYPPKYNLSLVDVPVTIACLRSDIIANAGESYILMSKLKKSRIVEFGGNHIDFWATTASINGITRDFLKFNKKINRSSL